jgi:heat shock protein HslJ
VNRTGSVLVGCVLLAVTGCRPSSPARVRAPQETKLDARIALTAIGSDWWRLAAWSAEEPQGPTPQITLRYAAGSFGGRSGCNRYTAPVEQRPGRGAIAVGAIAVTRMMCPPPIDAIEGRFLAALGRARAVERRDDRLGLLTTDEDGHAVTLVFMPESHPAD